MELFKWRETGFKPGGAQWGIMGGGKTLKIGFFKHYSDYIKDFGCCWNHIIYIFGAMTNY